MKDKKDKYIKTITIFSCFEIVSLLILILSAFHYYVGTQSGDYLFNELLNILIIVFLIVLLITLWILKFILKRKRRKFLMDFDNP